MDKPLSNDTPVVLFPHDGSEIAHKALNWAEQSGLATVFEFPPERGIETNWVNYDLGVNFLGTKKIQPAVLNTPRFGWVNLHPGPLPEYRGRDLCYHAILDKAAFFGATLHYMDEEFDTGPIIDRYCFPISPSDTAGDLSTAARSLCFDLLKAWFPQLVKRRVPASRQDPALGNCYRKGQIEDVIHLSPQQELHMRALTAHPKHHAKVVVGGRVYKIVPDKVEE